MLDNKKLTKLMKDNKISNIEMTARLSDFGISISVESIKKYKAGGVNVPSSTMSALATILKVTEQDLYINSDIQREQIAREELNKYPEKYLPKLDFDKVDAIYYEDIYACMGSNEVINDTSSTSIISFDRNFLEKELGKGSFKNLQVIKAIGDSMSPTIKENELLIISPFENDRFSILSGAVYVITIDHKPFVRRLSEHPLTGNIEAYPDNERHPTINIKKEDRDSLRIIGRVLGHFSFM